MVKANVRETIYLSSYSLTTLLFMWLSYKFIPSFTISFLQDIDPKI